MKKLGFAGIIVVVLLLLAGCAGGNNQTAAEVTPNSTEVPTVNNKNTIQSESDEHPPTESQQIQPGTDTQTVDTQTTDTPTTDTPTTGTPTTDTPTTDTPTTDTPTTGTPTTGTPTTDKPIADKPTTDKPTSDKPISDTPTSSGATTKPSVTPSAKPEATAPVKAIITLSIIGNEEWGTLLTGEEIVLSKGDKPVDVLIRAAKAHRLSYEIRGSGALTYIEGIDGLYEFDDGPTSGWKFRVNGKIISVGAGTYELKSGDRLEWFYGLDDYSSEEDKEDAS